MSALFRGGVRPLFYLLPSPSTITNRMSSFSKSWTSTHASYESGPFRWFPHHWMTLSRSGYTTYSPINIINHSNELGPSSSNSDQEPSSLFSTPSISCSSDSDDACLPNPTGCIPKTEHEFNYLMNTRFKQPSNPHMCKVAIIGMPNAGKSTLMNQLVGTRISSVSTKVHTTRRNVIGILNEGSTQVLFTDSPGLVTNKHLSKHHLEQSFMMDPDKSAHVADIIMVVVDASNPRERKKLNQGILNKLKSFPDKQAILVLNKIDLMKKKRKLFDVSFTLTQGKILGVPAMELPSDKKGDGDREVTELAPKTVPVHTEQQLEFNRIDRSVKRMEKKGYFLHLPSSKDVPVKQSGGQPSDQNGSGQGDQSLSTNETVEGVKDNMEREMDEEMMIVNEGPKKKDPSFYSTSYLGWGNFAKVFMVSAETGDGVEDIRRFLIGASIPRKWRFNPTLITPQSPVALVTLTIKEKLLNHLPHEIPYGIVLRVQSWAVTRTGTLCVCMDVHVPKKRYMSQVLGPDGKTISSIASEARQDLSNSFKCDVSLKLVVKCRERDKDRDRSIDSRGNPRLRFDSPLSTPFLTQQLKNWNNLE